MQECLSSSLLMHVLLQIIFWIQMQSQKEEVIEAPVHFGKFNIFLLTKTAQNAYGMKNGDYSRYRRYCSHKVFKLRQSLGLKLGNKTKFIRKDLVKEKPNDSKTLQILLFNAEKNWAFANETKFSQTRKPSQKSRARFFSIKKLKKALEWTGQLRKVCAEKTENITQLQAHAYELFLQGSLEFEREKWASAQSKLIACREIMSDIGKVSDSLSEKVFKEKIDQIEQTIKFCNFKISKGKELSITEIVQLRKGGDASLSNLIDSITEKRLGDIKIGETGGEIYFGNQRYPIKQEAIIKQKAKMENSQANLEEIKQKWLLNLEDDKLYEELLSLYSNLIIEIEEAINLCDSEREDSKKKEKYTQGELEILKKVSFLFTEIKMKVFIDRNLVVFRSTSELNRGRKSSPQTIAKLLTATMSLFQQLGEVIKQKGQISNSFQIQQVQAIDAKNFYLRALRLFFVGQVYFNNNKLKQAYGLWNECERCVKILMSKQEMNENKDDDHFIGSLIPLGKILDQVRTVKCKSIILNYETEEAKKDDLSKKINDIDINENTDNNRVLATSLQRLISESKEGDSKLSLEEISQIPIIDLPGRPQPIPTRPIFFDIFYHGLVYPQVQSKIKKAPANKSTSWWGRIFK